MKTRETLEEIKHIEMRHLDGVSGNFTIHVVMLEHCQSGERLEFI
jgi:hypothetical protein